MGLRERVKKALGRRPQKQNRRHFAIPYYVNEPFNRICDEYGLYYSHVVTAFMQLLVDEYEKAKQEGLMDEFEEGLRELGLIA